MGRKGRKKARRAERTVEEICELLVRAEVENGPAADACRERAERLAGRLALAAAKGGPDAVACPPAPASAAVEGDDAASDDPVDRLLSAEDGFKDALVVSFAAAIVFVLATAALAVAVGCPSILGPYPEEGVFFAGMIAICAWFSAAAFAVYSAANAVEEGIAIGRVRETVRLQAAQRRRGDVVWLPQEASVRKGNESVHG